MIISVINHAEGQIKDEALQSAIRAINRQVEEDFAPHWGFGAPLRLEGRTATSPKKQELTDMRGDAVIYLWNKTDVPGALGYHDANNHGIPFGFVFTELSQAVGENWTVTLSHEALELIGDSEVNLLVMRPHPAHPQQTVFHWCEMFDAVQAESYTIDEVEVSNFVLPPYFTGGWAAATTSWAVPTPARRCSPSTSTPAATWASSTPARTRTRRTRCGTTSGPPAGPSSRRRRRTRGAPVAIRCSAPAGTSGGLLARKTTGG
jgi:hypothetical protein